MTDDNEDEENSEHGETTSNIHPADLYDDEILYASNNVKGKRAAIDILLLARKLQKIAGRSVVCDEQSNLVHEAVESIITAADSTWPGDSTTVPPIEELAAWPDDSEDVDKDSED